MKIILKWVQKTNFHTNNPYPITIENKSTNF